MQESFDDKRFVEISINVLYCLGVDGVFGNTCVNSATGC